MTTMGEVGPMEEVSEKPTGEEEEECEDEEEEDEEEEPSLSPQVSETR